ncbi:MAG: macro domain-containing protein [Saprospiraceae bacterium]|nr:MAG: macro domain-containing protein [Saprospiraceae bacterium]
MEIKLISGDITTLKVDAIVNAANSSLMGGGGVDGAIHRKGGSEILEACIKIRNKQGGCDTGQAVITTAGLLPAQYVIHTVGPVWQDGNHQEAKLLRSCYLESLRLAEAHSLKTVAFPNISTGVYRFPKPKAAEIAIQAVQEYARMYQTKIEEVTFVCFDQENFDLYNHLI